MSTSNEKVKLHCPACDVLIDADDKFCPNCGKPTGFSHYHGKKIVEHTEEPEVPVRQEQVMPTERATMGVGSLLGSLTAMQKVLALLAAIALMALVTFIIVQATSGRAFVSRKNLPVAESFDSLVSILPKGSRVIARFPDEQRHTLYYMNKQDGKMYCFDGKMKTLDEVPFGTYRTVFVQKALLSSDEKNIHVEVQADEQIKYFKINTETKNIVEVSRNNVEIGKQQVIGEDQPVQPAYRPKKTEVVEEKPLSEVDGQQGGAEAPAVAEPAPATPAPATPAPAPSPAPVETPAPAPVE